MAAIPTFNGDGGPILSLTGEQCARSRPPYSLGHTRKGVGYRDKAQQHGDLVSILSVAKYTVLMSTTGSYRLSRPHLDSRIMTQAESDQPALGPDGV